MLGWLGMAAAIALVAPDEQLLEASRALEAGRLDQARSMIAKAVAAKAPAAAVDRLLAELAFRDGRNAEALERYLGLLKESPTNSLYAERAAIAALKQGDAGRAADLAARATASPAASWRAWNALGVASDLKGDWAAADAAYGRASRLAPDRAEVLNNKGWSLMLRGAWHLALPLLERAAALDPQSTRSRHNLELVRVALAEDLPPRRAGESDQDYAARLNDAGVMARIQGAQAKAVAAFTRAIETRGLWYRRAAQNLELAQSKP
jgi:Flp pilus assembly protein TadD